MIELKNIVKIFPTKKDDIHAVNGVSLQIQDGEIYGIIGYSGAGKSTLVRIINQLETQSAGDVIIDGRTMQTLGKKELRQERQKIGMIFQHFNLLWSRTVQKNIELPLEFAGVPKEEREKKAKELIHLVGLDGRENSYPSELSGGQKQRVGIARALANDPKILLSDEATSALDPDTTEQILELLRKINQEMGITIVMITHQMEVVQKICSRMAVMSDGVIVEEGTVKEIFEHPRHEVTKRFVQNVNATENIEELAETLKKKYPDGCLLRLIFTSGTDEPVIADAIRQVSFPISIVQSDISASKDGSFGTTYLHLFHAKDAEYNRFVDYLVASGVKVEVL
ncbi:MAG: ATP-binding cassette domain-containing protein [Galactobacillus timonensis]|uniref:methionine ABC transporter ATP-binding protein n=2 Tax=Galactobacillus timonensis TaxID=2041840 RepID=UPI0023F0B725|nr:ATP-binding cassette domain-containing protein [Galactobacillus timonensis]MDY5222135.1 ATP-binding cassette domain-containing protein [Lachnospiraceae bacterium]MDY6282492.1 ATP-binding cassette domain-containing protein [Erysipelotrichaceae bacterium]MCI6067573.1 ATP-binding cassette domain-containing protein [Galactobacillus timonensis]MCI6753370.1 ATP-binding cassette domain-containing protein [Galactobacillus timonensis]MDD6599708.1 ATP-binding cassette domain-containing protein [Galac